MWHFLGLVALEPNCHVGFCVKGVRDDVSLANEAEEGIGSCNRTVLFT